MNLEQVKWARRHDWFISATLVEDSDNDYIVHVRDAGTQITESIVDFMTLQNWAGY